MTPESTAAMTKIVNTLLRKPYSADFRKPLDFRSLGLDDYPQIIAKPMDLGTVKQKIERQGYMSVEQCADDIRLIWSNCKRYNGEGSDFYNLADRLSKQFEELFSKEFPKVKAKKKRGCPLAIDLTEEASPQEKKLRKSINDVAADLVCPITQELPIEPVMAEDGKIYEKKAILEWLSRDATSPVTRARMGSRLLPAIQTRNTIEALVKSGAIGDELTTAWKQKLADVKLVKEMHAKAEGGDGSAMYRLGGWCNSGMNGLTKDDVQARAWYERSAAARHPKGMAAFGECLLLGIGGPQDNALGLVNVTEAAYLGSDVGVMKLGRAFYNGKYGLPRDPARAKFWLKKIIDRECKYKHLSKAGNELAARWLRRMEMMGRDGV